VCFYVNCTFRNNRLNKISRPYSGTRAQLHNSRGTTLVLAFSASTSAAWTAKQNLMAIHVPQITMGNSGFPNCSVLLSDRSSGRISSLSYCPGSHQTRGRWQRSRLTRFHHRFSTFDWRELCHISMDWSINEVLKRETGSYAGFCTIMIIFPGLIIQIGDPHGSKNFDRHSSIQFDGLRLVNQATRRLLSWYIDSMKRKIIISKHLRNSYRLM
jgi:hypothetical protein